MLYRIFRVLAGLAVRWFYRDVEVIRAQLIPDAGPAILAVNHPNALLDALVMVDAVSRPVMLTAKATLFEVPVLRSLLRHVGIVPLRRASDEKGRGATLDQNRNEAAFDAIVESLRGGNAILIFPEGRTHSEPSLGVLKSGLARIALRARDAGVHRIQIIPIGLVFERKWEARSRVVVAVGKVILLDDWRSDSDDPVASLMADVQERLESVTLNFRTSAEAEWQLSTAQALSAVFDDPRELGSPDRPWAEELQIVHRVERARQALANAEGTSISQPTDVIQHRVEVFSARLHAFHAELSRRGIPPSDVGLATTTLPAAWFIIREACLAVGIGTAAAWGWVNHAAPLWLARRLSHRLSRGPEDPAMYTVAIAVGLLAIAYAIQGSIVWRLAGGGWATVYLLTLPVFGIVSERYRDRMRRGAARIRAYWQLRLSPQLQEQLGRERSALREEAMAIEAAIEALATEPLSDTERT